MRWVFGLLTLAGVLTPGCVAEVRVVHPVHRVVVYEREDDVEVVAPPAQHRVVVVENVNECYWYEGHYYRWTGHVHGPNCGHYYIGGRWVLCAQVKVVEAHHCGPGCCHYWHDGRWFFVSGHRHGPGCGHVFIQAQARWVVRW